MGEIEKLTGLAEKINAEHRACEEALRSGLRHAVRAGELLAEAKGQVKHGEWGRWLEENFEASERTAQAYMKVAREIPNLDGVKAQRVADLSFRGALRELASPKSSLGEDHELEARVEATSERLAYLRWHWTMDESNPQRVSFSQYAQQVGRSEREIRKYAEAYVIYAQQEGS